MDRRGQLIEELLIGSYKSTANIAPETIANYTMLLADIPTATLQAGILKCIKTCKFFPTIAEIREASQNFVAEITDNRVKDYAEAWAEVWQNMKDTGAHGVPKWSTAEIKQAVDTIGWMNICLVEDEKLSMLRAQFRDIYNTVARRGKEKRLNEEIYKALPAKQREQVKSVGDIVKQLASTKSIRTID